MRSLACSLIFAAALLSPSAHAQFANHSFGVGLGYQNFNAPPGNVNGIDWGLPLSATYSLYLEGGLEFAAHLNLMLLINPINGEQYFGFQPTAGVRYLFSQESFRPYAGFDLAYLQFFVPTTPTSGPITIDTVYLGLAPNIGALYFPSDSWSVGLRLAYTVYYWFNVPNVPAGSVTIGAEVAWYF